jgi:hypothetical protein
MYLLIRRVGSYYLKTLTRKINFLASQWKNFRNSTCSNGTMYVVLQTDNFKYVYMLATIPELNTRKTYIRDSKMSSIRVVVTKRHKHLLQEREPIVF